MDILIGKVTHFYNRLSVAVVELAGELRLGDQIAVLGHTTELTQPVKSSRSSITRSNLRVRVKKWH